MLRMAFGVIAKQMEVREMKRITEWLKADFGFLGYKMPVGSSIWLIGALAFMGLGIANYAEAEDRFDAFMAMGLLTGSLLTQIFTWSQIVLHNVIIQLERRMADLREIREVSDTMSASVKTRALDHYIFTVCEATAIRRKYERRYESHAAANEVFAVCELWAEKRTDYERRVATERLGEALEMARTQSMLHPEGGAA